MEQKFLLTSRHYRVKRRQGKNEHKAQQERCPQHLTLVQCFKLLHLLGARKTTLLSLIAEKKNVFRSPKSFDHHPT